MDVSNALNTMPASYIREILAAASNDQVISLAGGLPDEKSFPVESLNQHLRALADTPEVFQYGETVGYKPLLGFLHQQLQLPENQQILACTGSQQALDLIARAYLNPGDCIAMEAPSYLGAMQVFRLVGANIETVAQTADGPDLDALRACFSSHRPKCFYAVPDFHNPTGVCWSLSTRQAVAALCLEHGVTLIEDAPYRELRFYGEALPMVSSFCPEQSLVLRSFSKIAAPGLRVGIVSGKKADIAPLIKVKQCADLHSSVPMQAVLLGLLQDPSFEQHLTHIRQLYHTRYQALYEALTNTLPEGCSVAPVKGGMFVWLTLNELDAFGLAKSLLDDGVAVVPSPVFYPQPEQAPAGLRLNFSHAPIPKLTQAVDRLVAGINRARL